MEFVAAQLQDTRDSSQCIAGSADELNCKDMLALNLRKLGEEVHHLAPRSYVILPQRECDGEFDAFVKDFMLSRALAILKFIAEPHGEQIEITAANDVEMRDNDPDESTRPLTHHESSQRLSASGEKTSTHKKAAESDSSVPVIRWEPHPTRPIDRDIVNTVLEVAQRYVSRLVPFEIRQDEWSTLRSARLDCNVQAGIEACISEEQLEAAAATLSALPPKCQLSLLSKNVWLLKPSLNGGGNGRGILLFDRLPEGSSLPGNDGIPSLLLAWQAAVGRCGVQGLNDARHGCILQKCIEDPHLVNRRILMRHWPTGQHRGCEPRDEMAIEREGVEDAVAAPETSLFKYNLRIWMLASLGQSPSCWLHREGYIDLSGLEFTNKLIPGAHVTNQLGGHPTRAYSVFQRQWGVRAFGEYLTYQRKEMKDESALEKDVYQEILLPQVIKIITSLFRALSSEPSSLSKETADIETRKAAGGSNQGMHSSSGKLKRFGLDFLVDRNLHVWLIEVNVLKGGLKGYGLAAAHGVGGTMKLEMTRQLIAEENQLRYSLMSPLKQQRMRSAEVANFSASRRSEASTEAAFERNEQPPPSFVRIV